ncbi:demethylmenaquinone methyltransferase [Desulfitobacterium metallireducens]|uniref:Demethylmenaquinone methyltransferase n=1 Tax=Desulfitobacterium metallireducens DSM 15288 TaxID=871968 RepID=W0EB06_9FIRM|nr:demethylmenaquinone methyltransferase [Desulfitobacterium metallireducens]AHF06688.1 ubiquinone/menaquinone biosynthesis methyltransferase [Desulfitobacterium metallireducens DSM 15288]
MDFSGKDKATYVQETFNSIAKRYDLMNTLMSFGLDKGWRRKAVRTVEAKSGMHMLDVCCGTGQLSIEIAGAIGASGKVTGLDFSENMLERAQENIYSSPFQSVITLMQGDAMQLPFPDNTFDGATVGWGLRNLPNLEQGVKEMYRVVKPGSMVVSLDMAKPTLPVFKQGYWFYFDKLVPWMGKIWAGKARAYQYLHDSAVEFPPQQELAQIFTRCGLVETRYQNLLGGVVAIVSGRKA